MNARRPWLYLSSLILGLVLSAVPAAAQPGEGWEPNRCPEYWRPGPYRGILLIGSLTSFEGYYFNVRWKRSSEGVGGQVGIGFYRPDGGEVPVEMIFQRVEWRSAGLALSCWKKTINRPNGPSSVVLSEKITSKVGYIAPRSDDGSGEAGCGQLVYDPYSPTDDPRCAEPGDPGGGTGGGGGGSGDDQSACHTEYVVIEISYDDGATWEVYWEGYATVCN